ncbi:putative hydrolases of HD superfamily [Piedraia hortae CBS 480.64]|uniref:5'-deoxynucleotidase n=1 Tax=Piedraia hortae CBS 480.64 TaxID=1314780 RepID=A0A6A7CDG5_9PEZI|nr:putative hydrolases of HD superfamily [Piedraia hortae CBS 480.64]
MASKWTVESALNAVARRPVTKSASPVPFFHLIERLKTTPREGWRRCGVSDGESIADHMYRMSLMTMLAPPSLRSRVDVSKCVKMALVHDMAESLVGDITPVEGVPKHEKSRRETETMDYICKELLGNVDEGEQGKELRELWQEYEESETLESKFVHDVDKIELLLQMNEYEEKLDGGKDLGEFARVAERVVLPECKEWANELLAERREFWASKQ